MGLAAVHGILPLASCPAFTNVDEAYNRMFLDELAIKASSMNLFLLSTKPMMYQCQSSEVNCATPAVSP